VKVHGVYRIMMRVGQSLVVLLRRVVASFVAAGDAKYPSHLAAGGDARTSRRAR
jgi:hypothetical protein